MLIYMRICLASQSGNSIFHFPLSTRRSPFSILHIDMATMGLGLSLWVSVEDSPLKWLRMFVIKSFSLPSLSLTQFHCLKFNYNLMLSKHYFSHEVLRPFFPTLSVFFPHFPPFSVAAVFPLVSLIGRFLSKPLDIITSPTVCLSAAPCWLPLSMPGSVLEFPKLFGFGFWGLCLRFGPSPGSGSVRDETQNDLIWK